MFIQALKLHGVAGKGAGQVGDVIRDEMEGGKGHFVLKILVLELEQALEEKLANRYKKAADNDVIEGGGQGDGIQEVGVLEGNHTFYVGFQSVDMTAGTRMSGVL